MPRSANKLIPGDFTPVPSLAQQCEVSAVSQFTTDLDAVALLVRPSADVTDRIGLDSDALAAAGFAGEAGTSLVVAQAGHPLVLVGLGSDQPDAHALRDAAAAAARATAKKGGRLGLEVPELDLPAAEAAHAVVEGALLARYRFSALQTAPKEQPLAVLQLKLAGADPDDLTQHIADAEPTVRACLVARDVANTPAGHLTATDLADVAVELGERFGFEVEAFDKARLIELGCGGLLGVNQGSTEEPRMIVLRYTPDGEPTGHLGLVGKGIMYDSGGISLKPSDPMHLLMKIDMGGAAAVLGAFTALRELGTTAAVTGWLCCTDNMPSGTAYKLGDVLVCRNGTTVEVRNTDAEGRLAMMDGLALAVEADVDAIVDIATLTGAALVTFGKSRAAILGNDDTMLHRVQTAAATTDEPVWQLPLERKYRRQLDSDIADIANLGGPFAGSITAALFLEGGGQAVGAHRHRGHHVGRRGRLVALQWRNRVRGATAGAAGDRLRALTAATGSARTALR